MVDLLDYDVRYGQGFLFSPPRPVRAEALQGIGDRSDVVARDGGTAADQAVPMSSAGRAPTHPLRRRASAERSSALAQLARSSVSRG